MELYPASLLALKIALKKYHYMGKMAMNWLSFSVFENGEFCGVIVYGYDANPNLSQKYNLTRGRAIELLRVALNGKQSSTSKAVAISLKLLKKYKPCISLVISYADGDAGHIGTLYQATNWYYVGSISNQTKLFDVKKNKYVHNRGKKKGREYIIEKIADKYKYLYPMNKEMRDYLETIKLPYPKMLS